jgi:4-hydroxythreonine-4-phosphate dehydrogenase
MVRAVCPDADIFIGARGRFSNERGQVWIPDVVNEADFNTIFDAIRSMEAPHRDRPLRFVGAGGLARAWAGTFPVKNRGDRADRASAPMASPDLFVVGSRANGTEAQLAAGAKTATVFVHPKTGLDAAKLAQADSDAVLVLKPSPEVQASAHDVAASLGRAASDVMQHRNVRGLLATGGDTATAVLDDLGIDALEIAEEIVPGIAAAHVNRNGRRLSFFTKPGGFGGADAFVVLTQTLR